MTKINFLQGSVLGIGNALDRFTIKGLDIVKREYTNGIIKNADGMLEKSLEAKGVQGRSTVLGVPQVIEGRAVIGYVKRGKNGVSETVYKDLKTGELVGLGESSLEHEYSVVAKDGNLIAKELNTKNGEIGYKVVTDKSGNVTELSTFSPSYTLKQGKDGEISENTREMLDVNLDAENAVRAYKGLPPLGA